MEDLSQMKSGAVLTLALLTGALSAQADFSYYDHSQDDRRRHGSHGWGRE
jgi:hypothetical protein